MAPASVHDNLPLHKAASEGNAAEVTQLLVDGVSHNTTNSTGCTPLHWAFSNVSVVRLLLNAGAEVDAVNNEGVTPLMMALGSNIRDVVTTLLCHGANVHARTTGAFSIGQAGATPLHYAAFNGQADYVRLLVAAGADVDAKTCEGATPLQMILEHRNFLWARGSATKSLPRFDATIDALLECNAHIDTVDRSGVSARDLLIRDSLVSPLCCTTARAISHNGLRYDHLSPREQQFIALHDKNVFYKGN